MLVKSDNVKSKLLAVSSLRNIIGTAGAGGGVVAPSTSFSSPSTVVVETVAPPFRLIESGVDI